MRCSPKSPYQSRYNANAASLRIEPYGSQFIFMLQIELKCNAYSHPTVKDKHQIFIFYAKLCHLEVSGLKKSISKEMSDRIL
jgi:hypothetical protein